MSPAGEDAFGELERYRPYLRQLASADVDARLQGKLDLSGVVQQTLWEAHRGRGGFNGSADGARLAWLRRILLRNLLDEVRRLGRANADLSLELSLDDSSAGVGAALESDDTSPSACAVRNEHVARLAAALEQLPPDQRTAVARHHLQGVPLAAVADELGRSKEAVAGLLHRGLTRLRAVLRCDSL